ncbi:MAG: hypothetical protein AB7K09_04430 [Planctomycetota bacterium]
MIRNQALPAMMGLLAIALFVVSAFCPAFVIAQDRDQDNGFQIDNNDDIVNPPPQQKNGLLVTAANPANGQVQPGAKDILMGKWTVAAQGQNYNANSARFVASGSGLDQTHVVKVHLHRESGKVMDPNPLAEGTYTIDNGALTLNFNTVISTASAATFYLLYDFANPLIDNNTFTASLQTIGTDEGASVSGVPSNSATMTVTGGGNGNAGLQVSANNPSDAVVLVPQVATAIAGISLFATAADNVIVNSVTIDGTGSCDESTSLVAASLVVDINSNGVYDSGTDNTLDSGVFSTDNGQLTLNAGGFTLLANQTVQLLVVFELNANGGNNNTVSCSISSIDADPATLAGINITGLPISSATWTIADPTGQLQFVNNPLPNRYVDQNESHVFASMDVTALYDNNTMSSLTIDANGTGDDTSIVSMTLVVDVNTNGVYDSGTDTLLDTQSFLSDNGQIVFNCGTLAIAQDTTIRLLIIVTFDVVLAEKTFQITVSDASISVGSTGGLPIVSSILTGVSPTIGSAPGTGGCSAGISGTPVSGLLLALALLGLVAVRRRS